MSERLTAEQIDALEAKEKAATKGEWRWRPERKTEYDEPSQLVNDQGDVVIALEDRWLGYSECGEDLRMDIPLADMDFIPALRNAAPELLAAARRGLEAERLLGKAAKLIASYEQGQVRTQPTLKDEINAHLKGGDGHA
jgi:hypothetical protein